MTYRADTIEMEWRSSTRRCHRDGNPVRVEVERADVDFWEGETVAELAREQGVGPYEGGRGIRVS